MGLLVQTSKFASAYPMHKPKKHEMFYIFGFLMFPPETCNCSWVRTLYQLVDQISIHISNAKYFSVPTHERSMKSNQIESDRNWSPKLLFFCGSPLNVVIFVKYEYGIWKWIGSTCWLNSKIGFILYFIENIHYW